MAQFYDLGNVPVSMEEWSGTIRLDRHIGSTYIGRGKRQVWVSTVFLGLNHAYDDGPPLLYETMVFGLDEEGDRDWSEREMHRYTGPLAALEGHERVVRRLSRWGLRKVTHRPIDSSYEQLRPEGARREYG